MGRATSNGWNSDTLPPIPKGHAADEPKWRKLFNARHEAYGALMEAEHAERQAAELRRRATQATEHYKGLLEELVTEPLFEVGGTDG